MAFFALVFAAEIIFSLPFHIPRFFRPDMMLALNITNTELGEMFAWYGVVAMLSYFPGGLLADRYSAKKLMIGSLLMTAAGGWYMSGLPQLDAMRWLFGWWGMTTILFFWAAMLRLTRDWGGDHQQGVAYGGLDAGRGAVAALASAGAVLVYSLFHGDNTAANDGVDVSQLISGGAAQQLLLAKAQLVDVIVFYSSLTVLAAIMVALFVAENAPSSSRSEQTKALVIDALLNRKLWLLALVIVTAYCGYKGADFYGLYMVEVQGYSRPDAAQFTSYAAWLRPVGAIIAGLLADRFKASKILIISFALLMLAYSFLAMFSLSTIGIWFLISQLVISYLAIFALRGIYFSAIAESKIPYVHTGTAIGFVSVIGYTPDVFFGLLAGKVLDAAPMKESFGHFFLMMVAISIIGLVAAWSLSILNKNR